MIDIHRCAPLGEDRLDAALMDDRRRPGFPGRGPQERAFPRIALDQVHRTLSAAFGEEDRDHESRKSTAAAEVEPLARRGKEREELGAVCDVARPYLGEGAGCDEVLGLLPLRDQGDQFGQAVICFT